MTITQLKKLKIILINAILNKFTFISGTYFYMNLSDFSAGHIGIVSIIGSLVSQEITKAITNTQDPVNNGCFFDAENLETACFMLKEETIFMQ